MMNVLLHGRWPAEEAAIWRASLATAAPAVRFVDEATAAAQPDTVVAAVVANPAPGALRALPGLRLIQSLWAGVDGLLADASLPREVPLARMVDPTMTRAMVQTALWAVIGLHRDFPGYAQEQAAGRWHPRPQRPAQACPVLVLGQGEMGRSVSEALRTVGYPVRGWSRADGRDALAQWLTSTSVLVNLLPLTAQTRGILDRTVFEALPQGAGLVNLARGAHLVESDLLAALDSGRLAHAVLDVFTTEPLPIAHPFWRHPRVTVLPHVAALTDPVTAAAVVADNLARLVAGLPLLHLVDRERGY